MKRMKILIPVCMKTTKMELDYNLIKIGDFVLANVSSSVNSKKVACIIFFPEKEDKLVFQKSYRLDLRPVVTQWHEVSL